MYNLYSFTQSKGSPYDHSPGVTGSLGYHPYAGPLGAYPFGDPAYRKNATRDATATLKAWLSEHRKNPYPTKGEKIMLAIITKMTLTQVSTWFANARRRLKKENKMTWTPRNRSEDEDDEDSIDLEKNDEDDEPLKTTQTTEMTKDPGVYFVFFPRKFTLLCFFLIKLLLGYYDYCPCIIHILVIIAGT